jgi:SAM-dependent methyltransferase
MQVRPPRKLLRALDQLPDTIVDGHRLLFGEIRHLLAEMVRAEDGPEGKIGIRDWIAKDIRNVLGDNELTGLVAEIGGSKNGLRKDLPEWDFRYLSLFPSDDPDMLVADITSCPQIPDESFDAVLSLSCFEHIERPWRAAEEITRILKPGGISYHVAPFSYFYHLAPIDHWRYTPDAFAAMFRDLEPLKTEFYGANRRRNNLGSADNPVDGAGGPAFAPDGFGGWRENWHAVYVGRKTPGWREKRIERTRQQIVVDIFKALLTDGTTPEALPAVAEQTLTGLALTNAGEVVRCTDGVGLGISSDEAEDIWNRRGKLGIKPSYRRFALLATSGYPAGKHAAV